MKWLEQRRRERRWWVATATAGVMSLILGVLGVVPVLADVSNATCVVDESDALTVSWTGVPDGLELTLVAETRNGKYKTVATATTDNIIGYGTVGSWTGASYPGAKGYSLYSDPDRGGGSVPCLPAGATVSSGTSTLAVHNGVGASNPGFEQGACPPDSQGRAYGWHFVLTGSTAAFVSVDVVFENAGRVTDFISDPSPKHAYVHTSAADTIVSATAVIDGPADTRMVLSHVCTPSTPPPPSETPTVTTAPTEEPTAEPTQKPTAEPTEEPTPEPTEEPTPEPTEKPTPEPTEKPTPEPTEEPTPEPTEEPTREPTATKPPTATTPPTPEPTTVPPDGGGELRASIAIDCVAVNYDAEVINSGTGSGLAEFFLDDVLVDARTVAPGQFLQVRQSIPPGQSTFKVLFGDTVLASTTATDPCEKPAPRLSVTVNLDCDADLIKVKVRNRGNAPGTANVIVDGVEVDVEVAPGTTEIVAFPRPTDPAWSSMIVTSEGKVLLEKEFGTACFDPEPEVKAEIDVICKGDITVATITIVNEGDGAGAVTIEAGGLVTEVDVDPGDTEVVVLKLPGTGLVTVGVSDDAKVIAGYEASDVCGTPAPELAAAATLHCLAGQIEVVVSNTGDGDGVAHVEIGDTVTVLTVPAGSEVTHVTGVAVGDTVRIVVHDGESPVLDTTFEDTCVVPEAELAATATVDCDTASVTVTIENTGDAAGTAVVTVDGTDVVTVQVAPGETHTEIIPIDPVTGHTVTVTTDEGGTTLAVEEIGPCSTPEADISAMAGIDCEAGSVTVVVTNEGDAAGTAVIGVNGVTETVDIPPASSVTRTRELVIGGTTDVEVQVDGVLLVDETIEETCSIDAPEIVASTVLDCANNDIVVRLENGGTVDGDAQVVINGSPQTVTVPAESIVTIAAALTDDGDYDVEVIVDGSTILTDQATGACSAPEGRIVADIALSCTRSEATISITNGLSVATSVVVTIDGRSETIELAAGANAERIAPLTEDDAYDISVTEEGGSLLVSTSGTFDCEDAEVKGKTEKKNPETLTELPTTGAARTGLLVSAGVALIATGGVAIKAGNVRRERLGTST